MAGVAITLVGPASSGGSGSTTIKATTPTNAAAVTLTNQAILATGVTDAASGASLTDRVIPFASIFQIVNL